MFEYLLFSMPVMRTKHTLPHNHGGLIIPNQPQRCILTDYFNNSNFSKLK
jgi:hypothetical protein